MIAAKGLEFYIVLAPQVSPQTLQLCLVALPYQEGDASQNQV